MNRRRRRQETTANVAEFMSISAARLHRTPGKPAVGQLTFRLNPGESHAPTNMLLTKSQLLRLRNDINLLLHDPEGWLFDPNDAAIRGRPLEMPDGFDAYFDEPAACNSPADDALKNSDD